MLSRHYFLGVIKSPNLLEVIYKMPPDTILLYRTCSMFLSVVGVSVGVVKVGAPAPPADRDEVKSSRKLSPDIG